jgi:muramidase (phage lysozyme)
LQAWIDEVNATLHASKPLLLTTKAYVRDLVDPLDLSVEERAALATIRFAEGADYNRLFGWHQDRARVFDPDSQLGHPKSVFTTRSGRYSSSAAGAYQAISKTWDEEVRKGTIHDDFSKENQDRFALARLNYRGLLDEVQAGDTSWIDAVAMGKEWASFPNSPYGQPTHASSELRTFYGAMLKVHQASP